jgi:CPSF A subunit region
LLGPVTALAPLMGKFVAVGLGAKLTIYTAADDTLDAVAFLDHGISNTAIKTLKNFILIGTFPPFRP